MNRPFCVFCFDDQVWEENLQQQITMVPRGKVPAELRFDDTPLGAEHLGLLVVVRAGNAASPDFVETYDQRLCGGPDRECDVWRGVNCSLAVQNPCYAPLYHGVPP